MRASENRLDLRCCSILRHEWLPVRWAMLAAVAPAESFSITLALARVKALTQTSLRHITASIRAVWPLLFLRSRSARPSISH